MFRQPIEQRAARHAALGDVVRLAIVEELSLGDRSPVELRRLVGIESNLLAHHLDVLDNVGLIERSRSSGDGRRRYVHLIRSQLPALVPGRRLMTTEALFICTHNSARSQLAAALWQDITHCPAGSAGTEPAARVHPGAVSAARRAGLELTGAVPRSFAELQSLPPLVVTVCDRAHEELDEDAAWLHWSIPDPVPVPSRRAFDAVVADLRERMHAIIEPQESDR